jgi:phosphoglycolate phosphatase-like HAD superfamily hydrolase
MVWLSDNVVHATIDRVLGEVGYPTAEDADEEYSYYYEDESEEEGSDETSAVSEITDVFDYLESNGKRFAATNLSKSLGRGSFQLAADAQGLDVMETDFGRVRSLGSGVMPIAVTSLGSGEFPIICSISLHERESTTDEQEIDLLPQQQEQEQQDEAMTPRILHDDFEEDDNFKKARTRFVQILADYIMTLRGTTRDGRLYGDKCKFSPQHHKECELALKALGLNPWTLHIAPKPDPFPYDTVLAGQQEELSRLEISLDRLQQQEMELESLEDEGDPLIGMTLELYRFD